MSGNGFIRRGPMAADVFEKQFTQIHNAVFRDPRMSFKAKGIFGLISTHRDGYGLSIESICACSTDGVAAVRTGLTELEAHGYLVRQQERLDGPTEDRPNAKRGSWGRTEYFITDMPDGLVISIPAPKDGEPQKPSSGPSFENRTTGRAAQTPRSAPSSDFPQTGEPHAENRAHKKITPPEDHSLSAAADGPARGRGPEREIHAARNTSEPAPSRQASVPQPRPEGQPHLELVISAYTDALSPVRPMESVLDRLGREAAELLALDWPVEHVAKLAGQLPGLGYSSLAKHAEFNPPAVAKAARKASPSACERHPAFEAQDCLRCAAEERDRLRREQNDPAGVDGAGLLARLRAGQSG